MTKRETKEQNERERKGSRTKREKEQDETEKEKDEGTREKGGRERKRGDQDEEGRLHGLRPCCRIPTARPTAVLPHSGLRAGTETETTGEGGL